MLNDFPRKTRLNEEVRHAIQNDQGSLRALAAKYGVNVKTIQKWRRRPSVTDSPRQHALRRNQLSVTEQAMAVAFRRFTLLPLDDCLYALQSLIPNLTRTTLYRCLKGCDIHQLPEKDIVRSEIFRSKLEKLLGSFRVDCVIVNTMESNFQLYIATDIRSKLIFAKIYPMNLKGEMLDFFKCLNEGVPYKINSVLLERGIFSQKIMSENLKNLTRLMPDIVFHEDSIWSKGQIDLTNRIIKIASENRDFYKTNIGFFEHADRFSKVYNKNIRLKSLSGLTPDKYISEILYRK